MTACSSLNGTAASTFSREGAQFWISRVIRCHPESRWPPSFSLLSHRVLGVVAALIPAVLLFLSTPLISQLLRLALITVVLLTPVGMIIDLARPLLDWTNPQKRSAEP